MNIELRHLRYFIAVAEELHFGRAAQRLAISQPPLSQQIQQLEQQIGAKLLARTNRSVQLTPAGAHFLTSARQILHSVEVATDKAARLHRGEEGTLRIGFTSSAPFISAVSDALFTFRQHYPDVHVKMQELNTRQQLAPLQEGQLDLGVMRNTPLPETLEHRLLLREPLCAVVHHAHRLAGRGTISLRELAAEPFVFFDPQVGTALYSEILTLLDRYAVRPPVAQEVGEAMTILGLVATGLGVSILPASFCRARLDQLCWLTLQEEDAWSEVWLVWQKRGEISAATQHLLKMMLRNADSK
ncbi:MAG TPA: LysR family transcriptional regulator [Erwinia sp.]|uniref:LysR family transcriptional regulator n=1 Tax=Erwinia citreus TaxID=558 RepID=UPI000E8535A4|nr:LysR family transcriptional regulator [Erwinia sp.]HBV38284.1 LysR family transcriptional regulator [Erwinia sp.]